MSNYTSRPPLLRRPAQVADPGELQDALRTLDDPDGRGAHLGLHRGRVQGGSLGGPPCCGHEVASEADAHISLPLRLALVLPARVSEGSSAA
jgi:hypothetical protein